MREAGSGPGLARLTRSPRPTCAVMPADSARACPSGSAAVTAPRGGLRCPGCRLGLRCPGLVLIPSGPDRRDVTRVRLFWSDRPGRWHKSRQRAVPRHAAGPADPTDPTGPAAAAASSDMDVTSMSSWRHERDIHVVTGTARKTRPDTAGAAGTADSRARALTPEEPHPCDAVPVPPVPPVPGGTDSHRAGPPPPVGWGWRVSAVSSVPVAVPCPRRAAAVAGRNRVVVALTRLMTARRLMTPGRGRAGRRGRGRCRRRRRSP